MNARALLLALLLPTLALADPPKTKLLSRTGLTGDAAREVVVLAAEFPPGASTGRHTHPGDEFAQVIEGELELLAEGRPPRVVRAGEAYHNPRGLVHETRNVGKVAARIASTLIVDRGAEALVIPTPPPKAP